MGLGPETGKECAPRLSDCEGRTRKYQTSNNITVKSLEYLKSRAALCYKGTLSEENYLAQKTPNENFWHLFPIFKVLTLYLTLKTGSIFLEAGGMLFGWPMYRRYIIWGYCLRIFGGCTNIILWSKLHQMPTPPMAEVWDTLYVPQLQIYHCLSSQGRCNML